jgi:hypothetical protein
MLLQATDYQFARLSQSLAGVWQLLGDWETRWARRRLAGVQLDRPVFLTGLARSGTTILLEELSKRPGVATHRYRDFPFLMTPLCWNWYLDRFQTGGEPVERPHKDRIHITPASPEAFEEPIWRHFFPQWRDPNAGHAVTATCQHPAFEAFYRDHLKKIVSLRGGQRYLSKGNYNFTRLAYLARLFPDARFLVPVRDPVEHVDSLVRQHRQFCEYAQADARVPEYLKIAGHFEFGPQRQPLRLDTAATERTREAWGAGNDHLGYAIQWQAAYQFVRTQVETDPTLRQRVLFVRHEDFCERPRDVFREIVEFTGLSSTGLDTQTLTHIRPSPSVRPKLAAEIVEFIENETSVTARAYGYLDE